MEEVKYTMEETEEYYVIYRNGVKWTAINKRKNSKKTVMEYFNIKEEE